MRNQGNGPNKGSHAKPTLFRSLEDGRQEQTVMLGLQSMQAGSTAHTVSRSSAQLIDFSLAMYILTTQLPVTRIGRMNNTGIATAIFTLVLLMTVCSSIVARNRFTNGAWMASRNLFYLAGLFMWGYFVNHLSNLHSSTQGLFGTLRWNNFIPLLVCTISLLHSLLIRRTGNQQTSEYGPQDDDLNDIVFRGEHSF